MAKRKQAASEVVHVAPTEAAAPPATATLVVFGAHSGFAGGSRLIGQGGASGRPVRRDNGQGTQEHDPEQKQAQGPNEPFAIPAPGHCEKSPIARNAERHAPLGLAGSRRR